MQSPVVVYGSGAIASSLVARFEINRVPYLWLPYRKNLLSDRLIGTGEGQSRTESCLATSSCYQECVVSHFEHFIFCLKTTQVKTLQRTRIELLKSLKPHAHIMFVCNGAVDGMLTEFSNLYPNLNIWLGIAYWGSRKTHEGRYFYQPSKIFLRYGQLNGAFDQMNDPFVFQSMKDELVHEKSIMVYMISKWMINAVANSLCLAFRLDKNEYLLEHKVLAEGMLEEVRQFALNFWGDNLVLSSFEQIKEEFWSIIKKTAHNQNSMLAHFLNSTDIELSELLGVMFFQKNDNKGKYPRCYEIYNKCISDCSFSAG